MTTRELNIFFMSFAYCFFLLSFPYSPRVKFSYIWSLSKFLCCVLSLSRFWLHVTETSLSWEKTQSNYSFCFHFCFNSVHVGEETVVWKHSLVDERNLEVSQERTKYDLIEGSKVVCFINVSLPGAKSFCLPRSTEMYSL